MKLTLLSFFFLVQMTTVTAQVVITPGAQLSLAANAQLVLENMDLVNNGSLLPGFSNIYFTGSASSSIAGSQPVQFYSIEINKTSGSSVLLQRGITVTQTLKFSAGFLDLNGRDADLGSTGILNGEQQNSRVIGSNGGRLLSNAVLNAPVAVNPGNLGIVITSTKNLGSTTIFRGHASQVNAG